MTRIGITSILLLIASTFAFAQNNVIVFSEDGQKFSLFVNGVQQNEEPSTNVHSKDHTGEGVALRIVFANESLGSLSKNISFLNKNTEVTAKITMTKKGYKLRYFGEAPIGTSPEPAQTKPEIVFDDASSTSEPGGGTSTTMTTTIEEVTTTSGVQVNENGGKESVEVNMGINGINVNMGIEINDGAEVDSNAGVTTTTTTTTTTVINGAEVSQEERPQDLSVALPEDDRCLNTIRDVSEVKTAIESESFSDDKMNVAKQALREQCVYVDGIAKLAELFSFEDERLEFVKFCYDRCQDQQNYYKLNSVFTFSDSKEDLERFLRSK